MGTINENIHKLRKERGMTLEELGKACGTTKQTIMRYEKGEITNIPYDKIIKLSEALLTTPAYLMGWEELNISKKEEEMIRNKIEQTNVLIGLYSEEEVKLLNSFRKASIEQKALIMSLIDNLKIG